MSTPASVQPTRRPADPPRPNLRRRLGQLLFQWGAGAYVIRFRLLRRKLSWRYVRAELRADVMLISYKKTGRTWLTMMLSRCLASHALLEDVNYLATDLIGGSVAGLPHIRISHDDNPHWKRPAKLNRSKWRYRNKKVIFLARDPRDVVVSLYFERTKRERAYTGTLHDFLHEREGSLDTILEYYNIWADQRHRPADFCLVRYEDLKVDAAAQIERILQFAGVEPVIQAHVRDAVQFGSFENMRAMESANALNGGRLRARDPNDQESFKTRRGKVGGYVDYLTPAEIEWMERKIARTLDPMFGYCEPPHVRAAQRSRPARNAVAAEMAPSL